MQSQPKTPSSVEREKVAPGIWRRRTANGKGWRYEVTYRDSDGVQRRQTVEGGKRAAETELATLKSRMGRGEKVAPNARLTFGDAAAAWMKAQGATLRPATQAAYQSSLDQHLLPAWGRLRLDRVDVAMVADLVERMQTADYRREVVERVAQAQTDRAGRKVKVTKVTTGYRPWTIRGVLTPAGRIFDFSRRRMGWAGANPVRELERNERPAHDPHERRILSHDELAKLIGAAAPPYRQVIATAGSLGLRLGEVLGLAWSDLDLDGGMVSVRFQIDRRGERVQLKTKRSRRVIEAPAELVTMLRAWRLATAYSSDADPVFASRTGQALDHRNVAQRGLARAAKDAGLDDADLPRLTFHALRHSHASAWIAAGGDLVELSARLGHRDPSITASIYSHEFEAAARSDERTARLDGMYGGLAASMAAADVSNGQQTATGTTGEVVDLQVKRGRAK